MISLVNDSTDFVAQFDVTTDVLINMFKIDNFEEDNKDTLSSWMFLHSLWWWERLKLKLAWNGFDIVKFYIEFETAQLNITFVVLQKRFLADK